MSTDRNRFTVSVDDEMYDAIEEFRHKHRITTRSKAIERLLELGIDELIGAIEETQKNKAPTAESAAEALYEVLYYFLGHPPTPGEIRAFQSVIPVICNGVNGSE